MVSVSTKTHKEYKTYSVEDVQKLLLLIKAVSNIAREGGNTPYSVGTFINHAAVNYDKVKTLLLRSRMDKEDTIDVPANLLFWLYRSCIATGEPPSVELPHISKVFEEGKERFFIVSKEEWMEQRNNYKAEEYQVRVSDHAKIQYLTRVLGLNMDYLLKQFPYKEITDNVSNLNVRKEHVIGDYIYMTQNNVCVTVLNKGMPTT